MLILGNGYFIGEGKKTIFSSQKARIDLDEARNRLVISNEKGILAEYDMNINHVKPSSGQIRFDVLNGVNRSAMKIGGPFIYLYNPKFMFAFGALVALVKVSKARRVAEVINSYSKVGLTNTTTL